MAQIDQVNYRLRNPRGQVVESGELSELVRQASIALKSAVGRLESGQPQVTLSAREAFGPYNPFLVFEVERRVFKHLPEPGERVVLEGSHGTTYEATVLDVLENQVRLDANHPYSDTELTLELTT